MTVAERDQISLSDAVLSTIEQIFPTKLEPIENMKQRADSFRAFLKDFCSRDNQNLGLSAD